MAFFTLLLGGTYCIISDHLGSQDCGTAIRQNGLSPITVMRSIRR